MYKLLEDEKTVIMFLKKYRSLREVQIRKLLAHKDEEAQSAIINGMVRRGIIYSDGIGNLKSSPTNSVDIRVINAFWAFLEFLDEESARANFRSNYPGQIFFNKDQSSYEILSIYPGEDNHIRALKLDENRDKFEAKYIIVLLNDTYLEDAAKAADGLDALFMVIPEVPSDEIPEIEYYQLAASDD